MAKEKITKKTIERIDSRRPKAEKLFIRDSQLTGFGICLTPTSATYIFERRRDGQTIRKTIGKVADIDLAAAKKLAIEMMLKSPESTKVMPDRLTLREATDHYLNNHNQLRLSSKTNYKTIYNHLHDWLDNDIRAITEGDILRRHKELSETKPAAANLTFFCLSAVIRYAQRHPDTRAAAPIQNPCAILSTLNRINPRNTRNDYLEEQEMQPFLGALSLHPDRTAANLLKLLLLTGMRHSEARLLKYTEIDLLRGRIRLGADRTKTKRSRDIPITEEIMSVFQEQLEARLPISDFVFVTQSGGAIGADRLTTTFLQILKQIEKENLYIHGLRRSFISAASRLDIPDHIVKKLVGHTDHDITSRYRQTSIEDLRRHMSKITAALMSPPAIPSISNADNLKHSHT